MAFEAQIMLDSSPETTPAQLSGSNIFTGFF
jgi:hypothetical protein